MLVTWLVYAAYLVVRNAAGWRGVRAAWITAIGFGASIFTFLGSNYLFNWGRHILMTPVPPSAVPLPVLAAAPGGE